MRTADDDNDTDDDNNNNTRNDEDIHTYTIPSFPKPYKLQRQVVVVVNRISYRNNCWLVVVVGSGENRSGELKAKSKQDFVIWNGSFII